jgi:hypothetical protein
LAALGELNEALSLRLRQGRVDHEDRRHRRHRGLIGSKTVAILRQGGHEVIAASPSSGVNSITGEGLKEAVAGAVWNVTLERLGARRQGLTNASIQAVLAARQKARS